MSRLKQSLLQITFMNLKQIVKLDLSRNMLDELPENFGEMTKLKHLDLYANKVNTFFLFSYHCKQEKLLVHICITFTD